MVSKGEGREALEVWRLKVLRLEIWDEGCLRVLIAAVDTYAFVNARLLAWTHRSIAKQRSFPD